MKLPYTTNAQLAISLAQEEGAFAGTGHSAPQNLLIALLSVDRESEQLLDAIQISAERVLRDRSPEFVADRNNSDTSVTTYYGLIGDAEKVASELGHKYVGPEHLLLAMLKPPSVIDCPSDSYERMLALIRERPLQPVEASEAMHTAIDFGPVGASVAIPNLKTTVIVGLLKEWDKALLNTRRKIMSALANRDWSQRQTLRDQYYATVRTKMAAIERILDSE